MNLEPQFRPFTPPNTNLVEQLLYWADAQPNEPAFYFLNDGETDEVRLTYRELADRTRAVAARLVADGHAGGRALLLFPPGIEFVEGFFGCLMAGVTAVPAYPPRRNRSMYRIQAISDDAGASLVLTDREVLEKVEANPDFLEDAPGLDQLTWYAVEDIPTAEGRGFVPTTFAEDDLALLQYTSGSTGSPKGVMLTHGNLAANCKMILWAFGSGRHGSGLTWLPLYHDMGLVGGVLQPLFFGRPNVLMSPMAFLARPARWLRAISRYGITISGGPNFAYQLCLDRIRDDELEGVDLSTWEVAFNGAEPIRADTLEKFSKRFARYGFRPQTHYPCYGMAETTLIVTGGQQTSEPIIRVYDGRKLDSKTVVPATRAESGARALVGCGRVIPGETIVIADPESRQALPEGRIGEIWIQGPSVGQGYLNKAEQTEATFQARLATGEGPFLRSGDLGFFDRGELFVTGRLKDMIIVRGVNRYPQDIERTVEDTDSRVRPGGVAAFAVEQDGRERLVVVAEVERTGRDDWSPLLDAVRARVTEEHELPPDGLVFVRAGSMPKTSSGKVQRHACKEMFESSSLLELARWVRWDQQVDTYRIDEREPRDSHAEPRSSALPEAPIAPEPSPLGVRDSGKYSRPQRLRDSHEEDDGIAPEVIDAVTAAVRAVGQERVGKLSLETNIAADLGLDSLERLQIASRLEEEFGGRFPEQILSEMETVRDVARAIQMHLGTKPVTRTVAIGDDADEAGGSSRSLADVPEGDYLFEKMPEYRQLRAATSFFESSGVKNPFFQAHEGITSATAMIDGEEFINFSNYDYIGMSGDEDVRDGARRAVTQFGTSVSASRLVAGQKTIHNDLEREIASFLGVEDSLIFSAGHATNETTIGHLMKPGDLILHDALAHNSIIQGAELSRARRRAFRHNDWEHLDELLTRLRPQYRRVMVAVEGVYSMDGDYPELPEFVRLCERHKCWLYVDEAHSLGTMGETGRGIGEHFGVDPTRVAVWMSTLSKSLASCGGYIAGKRELIDYLRYSNPGFVFSCGIAPSAVGAALASLRKLQAEPERVAKLRANSDLFLSLARDAGLDTGQSGGTPVIPVITKNSLKALAMSQGLRDRGINAMPILYPAVPEDLARVRFFIGSRHTSDQIRRTVAAIVEVMDQWQREGVEAALRPARSA